MNILVLESKLHHLRAKVFDEDKDFPNCNLTYSGGFNYNREMDYFRQYDLIVSTVFTSPTSNLIVERCRKYGIKTLLLSDGIIEWENMYSNEFLSKKGIELYLPIRHDYFGVMGSLEAKYFDKINNSKSVNFTPNKTVLDKTACVNNLNGECMVVDFLLTSANRIYLNENEKKIAFKIYIEIFKTLNNMRVSFKTRIFDEELLNEFRKINPSIHNDIDSSFEDCIKNVAALLTGPSTIVFSAMKKNMAVAQILYRNTPIFTLTGWLINSINDLEDTLLSMLEPDDKRLAFQKSVLEDHLDNGSLIEQIEFDNKNLELYDIKEFYASKYVLNMEPVFRIIDDTIKTFFPKKIISKWKKFISKYK